MSLCVVDGKACRCQPEENHPCPGVVELKKAHARYEHVRRLNPHQFRELWERNLRGDGPFDALVDSAISLMVSVTK